MAYATTLTRGYAFASFRNLHGYTEGDRAHQPRPGIVGALRPTPEKHAMEALKIGIRIF